MMPISICSARTIAGLKNWLASRVMALPSVEGSESVNGSYRMKWSSEGGVAEGKRDVNEKLSSFIFVFRVGSPMVMR